MYNPFRAAEPVWPKGLEYEKNLVCGFKSIIDYFKNDKVYFKIAASTVYRFFINGKFAGFGPARGPHGFYRVDEWEISGQLQKGENVLSIEVAGYNINSYYHLNQPSFIQAEIISGDAVIAASDVENRNFCCGIVKERIQKTQRYSFQRPFTECYHYAADFDKWRKDKFINIDPVILVQTGNKTLIKRNLPCPTFVKHHAKHIIDYGNAVRGGKPEAYFNDRSLKGISNILKGYKEEELEVHLTDEAQEIETSTRNVDNCTLDFTAATFEKNTYKIFDFGINKTGFISVDMVCEADTTIYLLFDEILKNNDVSFLRLNCANVIKYELESGHYELQSFEPYTMRYLKIVVLGSACKINELSIREYTAPVIITAKFENDNTNLTKIYDAAIETFRQNSADLYMDCPSRERAGWLCDSFFTSRVEHCLTGKSVIERNFLENYILPLKFDFLPDGMLPMCYPADHNDGIFIPNWALWFVFELDEYFNRTGDSRLVDAAKDKVYGLFNYFNDFINEYGLLEKLEGWIFIEWSKANELVQNVNFPTNMLYAGALEAAGRLYNDSRLVDQAVKIKEFMRSFSFNGSFFIDNAIRENGSLSLSGESTEVCQYYAFFFDLATPSTHKVLWDILINKFGPQRKKTNEYPDIHFANAFIGNYLRLDVLSRYGLGKNVLEEIEGYFIHMAEKTGTLWEHDSDFASCNHGFASYVAYWLLKNGVLL